MAKKTNRKFKSFNEYKAYYENIASSKKNRQNKFYRMGLESVKMAIETNAKND